MVLFDHHRVFVLRNRSYFIDNNVCWVGGKTDKSDV
ncbi:hypothetical protein PAND9192_01305 [Photobacterium andalusiense]|uniref:Uncharacterized protein n=1 Tax=Photobacterium andalusiense TaxID=2204296 RepID=A0A1Y6MD18_9GAMM|nr:hypothetical protein PAND9192_01305 [Photobacterium andalusiense]